MTKFSDAIVNGIENFFSISGRMSRSGFWWFALFFAGLVTVVSYILISQRIYGVVNILVDLSFYYIMIVPGIRRLHDIDKSGSNALWMLLPVLGWIYLIYLYCQPSDPNDNYYGQPTQFDV